MGLELLEGGNGNSKVKGLPADINPSKQPKSYKEALRRSDKEQMSNGWKPTTRSTKVSSNTEL